MGKASLLFVRHYNTSNLHELLQILSEKNNFFLLYILKMPHKCHKPYLFEENG